MAGTAAAGTRRRITPYLLSLPALAYLAVFFVIPLWTLFRTSLSSSAGSVYDPTLEFSWEFSNYSDAFRTYDQQILRSFWYALAATLLALVLAYPLAYVLAFKSGRWKNALLGLVILPFFITFIIRTLAWKTIFADSSVITSVFDFLGPHHQRPDPVDPVGGHRGADLQLPALHDPAHLREHREDRPAPAGGGPRPLRRGDPDLP